MITDIPMPILPQWIQLVIISIFFVITIVVHEQAHYKALTWYYKDAQRPTWQRKGWRFHITLSWPEEALSKEQERDVYLAGIIFGLIPLVLSLYFVDPIFSMGATLLYVVGSWHDIISLWRTR